jgi:hypothetical protein
LRHISHPTKTSLIGMAAVLFGLGATSLSGCRPPDTQALKKLACEQAAASLAMQSVSQMDALRKALGLAPDVDPIQTCRDLGANMQPPNGNAESGSEASN